MIPEAIQVKHINAALARVRRDGVPPRRESTKFDLLVDENASHPNNVIALAAEEAQRHYRRLQRGLSAGGV